MLTKAPDKASNLMHLWMITLIALMPVIIACQADQEPTAGEEKELIELPEPRLESDYSVEEALASRRSVREYSGEPLELAEVSQLLWAAQGITLPGRNFRTAPSAGATFPIYLYLIVSEVNGLETGLYKYDPVSHSLEMLSGRDIRAEMSQAVLRQAPFRNGACSIVITADYERTTGRYGERGIRYVHNEVGHVGQNVHLQAEALNLGTVVIGAFRDEGAKEILNLPDNIDPLYIMPVGRK